MNQEFEIQLQVVQRALGEVIAPALKHADKHVIEQLHLSMAALGFMQQRLPRARHYYRATLQQYLAMAGEIGAMVPPDKAADLGAMAATGKAALDDPAATDTDLRHATAALRSSIAALVEASNDTPHEQALDSLILAHSDAMLLQDRAWCIPLGFELRPQDLPKATWDA